MNGSKKGMHKTMLPQQAGKPDMDQIQQQRQQKRANNKQQQGYQQPQYNQQFGGYTMPQQQMPQQQPMFGYQAPMNGFGYGM